MQIMFMYTKKAQPFIDIWPKGKPKFVILKVDYVKFAHSM